jgi:hypothetical protein
MRAVAALALAGVMAMTGCSDDDDGGDAGGGAGTTAASSNSTSVSTTAAPAVPAAGQALCVDPPGDVATGAGTDLAGVSLTRTSSGVLAVTYQLAGDAAPASGSTSWILAIDQGVNPLVSLVVKAVAAQPPSSYAFDFRTGRTTGVTTAPTISGNRVTAEFPISLDPLLAGDFHWLAVSNNGTADVDRCEGGFPQT